MTVLPLARDGKKQRRQNRVPLLNKQCDDEDDGPVNGASFSSAVFNLSTTVVGAGIMALPAAVKVLGLIPGIIAIITVGALTEYSIDIILRVGRSPPPSSYGAVVGEAFGSIGRTLLQTCIVVNNLGMLIVYMIIIGDVLSGTTSAEGVVLHIGVLEGWFGHHSWTTRSFVLFITMALVLAPLISLKRVVHPIENELKDATQMKSIVRTSIGLCTIVYIATSFFGFLLFGEQTLDDVLANFDVDLGFHAYGSLLNDVVRVSYTVHLMLVFPIIFYSLRLNLDALLFPLAMPLVFDGKRFFAVTVGLMGSVFIGANFVPNIWIAFQFTGATAAVAIGFIFPAAIALRNVHGVASLKDKALWWLMILLAVSSSTVAISSDVYDLIIRGDSSSR